MTKISGIYICLFSNGTIKVGRGAKTSDRIAAHRTTASAFGIHLIRSDSVPCDNAVWIEKNLIEWCSKNSRQRNAREWFQGASYDDCLAFAKLLQSVCIGPHKPKAKIDAGMVLNRLGGRKDKSYAAFAYDDARRRIVESGSINPAILGLLDRIHQTCESVRELIRLKGSAPEWFDRLNFWADWEVELFFCAERPTAQLLFDLAEASEQMACAD